jgi:UPF0716 family protein affecting phage T7 exclusion
MVALQHPKPQRFDSSPDLWFMHGFCLFVMVTSLMTLVSIATVVGVGLSAFALVLSAVGATLYASRLWQHYSAAGDTTRRPLTMALEEHR